MGRGAGGWDGVRVTGTLLGMDLEERTLEDTLERSCAVCGAQLTTQEIHESRESGGPFLCSVHAAEELPAEEAGQLDDDVT
jgi:hypothetical protein